jgi:hypothetical protein
MIGLDPSDRLSELTSGIAVVLTLLVGTSFYSDDVSDPRRVLVGVSIIAALASGLAGGVMNVVEDLYEDAERRYTRLEIDRIAAEDRRAVIREHLHDELEIEITDEVADGLIATLLQRPTPDVRVEGVNLRDVGASVLLNMVALVPVMLAFWLIGDWNNALLAAELSLVVGLFLVGYLYGFRLRFSPIVCGVSMMLVGIGLVAISALSESI